MQVFLSYRRNDSSGHAGRLADALLQQFGSKGVFQDVAAIGPGRDFSDAIAHGLAESDAVLVVIGPKWLGAAGPSGKPRLHEPDDYVRLELATALSLDVPVVPVLVGGAELPTIADLPADVAELAQRQAVVLRDDSWRRDVDGLIRSLRGAPAVPLGRRRLVLAVVAGIALVGATAWLLSGGYSGSPDDNGSALAACIDPTLPQFTPLDLRAETTKTIMVDDGPLEFTVVAGGYRELAPGSWEVVLDMTMTNLAASAHYHAYWHYDVLAIDGRPFEKTCFSPESEVQPDLTTDARIGFETTRNPAGVIGLLLEGAVIDLTS